jgi:hypothetical protein
MSFLLLFESALCPLLGFYYFCYPLVLQPKETKSKKRIGFTAFAKPKVADCSSMVEYLTSINEAGSVLSTAHLTFVKVKSLVPTKVANTIDQKYRILSISYTPFVSFDFPFCFCKKEVKL